MECGWRRWRYEGTRAGSWAVELLSARLISDVSMTGRAGSLVMQYRADLAINRLIASPRVFGTPQEICALGSFSIRVEKRIARLTSHISS